jgi:phage tail-like protein
MARSGFADPLKSFKFALVVDGFQMVGFRGCNGLGQTTDVIDFRHSDEPDIMKKLPGLTNASPLTLSRGMLYALMPGAYDFWNWASQVIDPNIGIGSMVFRKDIWLIQFGRDDVPARTWYVREAWPSNFRPVGDLESSTSEVAIEELEIQNEGVMPFLI